MPQTADGMRIDPPVSVPMEPKHMPSISATAAPPLEPPAERDGSRGCVHGPNAVSSLVVPNANSCRFVLPMITAPAFRSRVTSGASASGWRAGTAEPDVVGVPATSTRSFTEIGIP